MRCKTVPEGVRGDAFVNAAGNGGFSDGFLNGGVIEMMTAQTTLTPNPSLRGRGERKGIKGTMRGRKKVLPKKFAAGVGIFLFKGVG